MAIFLDKNARVIVQGVTGREGAFHTRRMRAYGTRIVGGVAPGKGGTVADGVPVFETVAEAVDATGASHTIIFVPPAFVADALYEAYDAGISLAVCVAGGVPVHDMLRVVATTAPMRIVGPHASGIVSPGLALLGIMPGHVFAPGNVGVISRSGTLGYEIADALTRAGLGQSTYVGIGREPIAGTTFVDCLRAFSRDVRTHAIVVCGEGGGSDAEDAAAYVAAHPQATPVVAYVGGPSLEAGTFERTRAAFAAADVPVADRPSDVPALVRARSSTASG